jgi:hypothetical protein
MKYKLRITNCELRMSMLKYVNNALWACKICLFPAGNGWKNVKTKFGLYLTKLGRQLSSMYDYFKHSFQFQNKGKQSYRRKTFLIIIFDNKWIVTCMLWYVRTCRRTFSVRFGPGQLTTRLDNSYYRPGEKKKRKDKVNHGSFHVFITFLFDTKTK